MSWIGVDVRELDTPCMVVDLDKLQANIERVQDFADRHGVAYRPHTKTHKSTVVAHRQLAAGARGITVAKLGEAEVMAQAGIDDIFIAHQIVGDIKLRRLRALAREITLCVGVDHRLQADLLREAFKDEAKPLDVMIEVDVGQGRSGVTPGEAVADLARYVQGLPGLRLRGIFTHEGHDYHASSLEELRALAQAAQQAMLESARLVEKQCGQACRVSIGSTPSLLSGTLLKGIDELRAGTCIYYDASMANIIGHTDWCAATVLATVTGHPAPERLIADSGGKALSVDRRTAGLLATPGYGHVVEYPHLLIKSLSDEHAVIIRPDDAPAPSIGEKIRIIPNHICPAVNLTDRVFAVRAGRVEQIWPVSARGRVL